MKLGKQRVFDDFIAAAEWLIANKYTTSAKLAIQGGSNGGLLVGACMTQRPELYAAALPAVGVLVLTGNIVRNTLLVAAEASGRHLPGWAHDAMGLVVLAVVCSGIGWVMARPARLHSRGGTS